jgi:hypothetical protein
LVDGPVQLRRPLAGTGQRHRMCLVAARFHQAPNQPPGTSTNVAIMTAYPSVFVASSPNTAPVR